MAFLRRVCVAAVLSVVLLTALPASAQTTTTIEPPAQPVRGRLLDSTGHALGGAPVVLNENRGVALDIFGLIAAAFTAGLSCAAGIDPCRGSGSVSAQTDTAGRFVFDVAQVNKARAHSRGVVLLAGDPATQGSVSVKLNPTVGGDLGDVALWNAGTNVTTEKDGLRVRWNAPPSANSRTELHGVVVDGGTGALAVFESKGTRGDGTIDTHALEDRAADIRLTAGFSRPRANQNPRIDWLARPISVRGAGVPLSRNKACRLAPNATASPCRLTDGDLITVGTTAGDSATVDLGASVDIGLIAARPTAGTASVSRDGVTWTELESFNPRGAWPAAVWEAEGSWRYVRLSADQPGTLRLAEISVWPAGRAPTVAVSPSAGSPTTIGTAAATAPRRDRPSRLNAWLVVLAIGVLALGCGFAGIAIGRRR